MIRKLFHHFSVNGRPAWALILLALAIHGLVLYNSVAHNPKYGYDALSHIAYLTVLPERLPQPEDTHEYFSPPLSYFLPSLFNRACTLIHAGDVTNPENPLRGCSFHAARFAQALNVVLSLGITFGLLAIAELLAPASLTFKFSTLLLLGGFPVYYKTMAQVRGEPYVAFFVVLMLWLWLSIHRQLPAVSARQGLALGGVVGLLVLSRQWGFLLLPVFGLWLLWLFWARHPGARSAFRVLAIAGVVSALVGGWFYLNLLGRFGSFTAFAMDSSGFSFANQPYSFYRHTHLDDGLLFETPVRPYFSNEFFPIFYSDTWGDYWGFFTFIKENSQYALDGNANEEWMVPTLGRINRAALFPTLLLLAAAAQAAWLLGRAFWRRAPDAAGQDNLLAGLLLAGVVFSMLGFFWFLVSYPELRDGSTIKPTYMIQIFILLPLLGANLLESLARRAAWLYPLLAGILLLIAVHNLPAMLTQYKLY